MIKLFLVLMSVTQSFTVVFHQDDNLEVQNQYIDLPYPPIEEETESNYEELYSPVLNLNYLNHYLFQGNLTIDADHPFRILIAGGGTGGTTITYANQIKDFRNSEVVYLDFSETSLKIAKHRAKIRGLTNIKFIHNSIYNIPSLNLGKFDLIESSGVLHHLPSPSRGLLILKNALKEHGGLILLLYAQYGRTGLYMMQDLMKIVNQNITSHKEQLQNGWTIYESLPNKHWIHHGEAWKMPFEEDSRFFDRYLHKVDRAYTVPELYDFIEANKDLHLIDFVHGNDRARFDNVLNTKKGILGQLLSESQPKDAECLAELIDGTMYRHVIFASKMADAEADMNDLNTIPFYFNLSDQSVKKLQRMMNDTKKWKTIRYTYGNVNYVDVPVNRYSAQIARLIGKGLSFHEIYQRIMRQTDNVKVETLHDAFKKTFRNMKRHGHVLLRRNLHLIPSIFHNLEPIQGLSYKKKSSE